MVSIMSGPGVTGSAGSLKLFRLASGLHGGGALVIVNFYTDNLSE